MLFEETSAELLILKNLLNTFMTKESWDDARKLDADSFVKLYRKDFLKFIRKDFDTILDDVSINKKLCQSLLTFIGKEKSPTEDDLESGITNLSLNDPAIQILFALNL